ncbi:CDP-alcohol phosphatidyltransferase family protein [Dissulfurispira sp.]|uniref:CDP-alcohol phosphatidyltransferase family protein n=1 Tax=Dissulfurispira sp. TaxID=2817609 RepID=UPI002FD89225
MISAKLGHFLDKPLAPIAKKISISPNILTILGFLITAAAAVSIPFNPLTGGLLILLGGFFDMLDGIVARTNGKSTKFGALLDSTLDRYSDSFIFIAVAWYFFDMDDLAGVIFTAGSLVGALLISYVRARAEGIGVECTTGLMERPERVVLLAFGCIAGWLFPVIVALFFFSHATAIQRILHVYKMTRLSK